MTDDAAAVSTAETSATSHELFNTDADPTDTFKSSSFLSPTITGFEQIVSVQSSTPVEYQMLMPLSTTASANDLASVPQVAAAAVSTAGPIIVGISLPTVDSVAAYQTFQPFDLQNARLIL